MQRISIPYHTGFLIADIPEEKLLGIFSAREVDPGATGVPVVEKALNEPYGTPGLAALSQGKQRVLVITSDHTRPMPSRLTMPLLLAEVRKGSPEAEIVILIATGAHRATTTQELASKFGEAIVEKERIEIHDAYNEQNLISLGRLKSGGELTVHRRVAWADLVVAEGFIEPHFFAGFSGGRKSILPGIAGAKTILENHCAAFIACPYARTGVLENNPIHTEMVMAARMAKLAFVLNVVLNEEKQVFAAFAGDMESAHLAGCDYVKRHVGIRVPKAEIVITSNGGYPMDQNIYQVVKGATAGEACVKEGGVIILCAACQDGHGGEGFISLLQNAPSPKALFESIVAVGRENTQTDQWQAQLLARVLMHATVILVSGCNKRLVESLHMRHADSLEQAISMSYKMYPHGKIAVIPDGVNAIIEK